MSLLAGAGRALTGLPYIRMGYASASAPGPRVEMAAPLLDKVRAVVPLPVDDAVLVRASGGAMVVGGTMVASSLATRSGAALVAATLVPTTLAGHAFWKETDPAARTQMRTQFLKNTAMLGGLLVIAGST
ncbi:DoxX family protein [Gordonia iterans]|uniref:DoxX family protein n=1 Tax=Gordonia iterans TaxID=1004901 RepID=A0A2S0KDY8_9ACTN|nr:DoxX family membrane protein [Gordonia iterans]AVL99892.1 DoxX family protein [Gordonia iterans]